MEPFIRSDQFHFIKRQAQILINGHSSVNDRNVLQALKGLSSDKTYGRFEDLTDEQRALLEPIASVHDKTSAELFLENIEAFVIPFKTVTQDHVKRLFPKVKKLKVPSLHETDLRELTYLSWEDKGTNRKYIVTERNGKLSGVYGTFTPIYQKGICAICNGLEEVGMFLSETKGAVQGTFTKRGNYICQDSDICNQNLMDYTELHDFIDHIQKK